jgi:hypothetical protein
MRTDRQCLECVRCCIKVPSTARHVNSGHGFPLDPPGQLRWTLPGGENGIRPAISTREPNASLPTGPVDAMGKHIRGGVRIAASWIPSDTANSFSSSVSKTGSSYSARDALHDYDLSHCRDSGGRDWERSCTGRTARARPDRRAVWRHHRLRLRVISVGIAVLPRHRTDDGRRRSGPAGGVRRHLLRGGRLAGRARPRLVVGTAAGHLPGVRPVRLHPPVQLLPGITSPLRNATEDAMDWVVVRENSEGEYAGIGGRNLASRVLVRKLHCRPRSSPRRVANGSFVTPSTWRGPGGGR